MTPDDKGAALDTASPSTQAEPPKIYITACGALCDIFWWARRDPSPAPITPSAGSKPQTP